MANEEELLKMKLHEEIITNDFRVLRVVGGWIYTILRLDCNTMSSVLVSEKCM